MQAYCRIMKIAIYNQLHLLYNLIEIGENIKQIDDYNKSKQLFSGAANESYH